MIIGLERRTEVGSSLLTLSLVRRSCSYSSSCVATACAIYSDSVEDSAMAVYFFEVQMTGPPVIRKTKLEVEEAPPA
jgi:hypothetical protein